MDLSRTSHLLIAAALAAAPLTAALAAEGGDKPMPGGKAHGEGHERMLEKFDTNKDGKLDETERAAGRADLHNRLKEKHPEMLKKVDTNGDGVISEDEFKAAREVLREKRKDRRDRREKEGKAEESNDGMGEGHEGEDGKMHEQKEKKHEH